MSDYLLDQALAFRFTVEADNASGASRGRLPPGMRYESVADIPQPKGPLVPGPAAHLLGAV